MKSKQIKKNSGLKRRPVSAAKSRAKIDASKSAKAAKAAKGAKPAKSQKPAKTAQSALPAKKSPRAARSETRGPGRGEHAVANTQAKAAQRKRTAGGKPMGKHSRAASAKSPPRKSRQATIRRGRDQEQDRARMAEDHQTHDLDASIAEQAVGTTNAAPLNDVPPPTDETAIQRVSARKR